MNHFQIVIFLLLPFFFNHLHAQSPLSKIIDFDIKNRLISDALIELSEAADINIAFHPQLFTNNQKVSGQFHQQRVDFILKNILSTTKVSYKINGKHLILYKTPPKQYIISGYLEDEKTGERLVAATIYDAYSGKGSTTNDYGFFSLKLPEGKVELHGSYLGYQEEIQTLELTKKQNVKIGLKPSITLAEVIITAADYNRNQSGIGLGKGLALNLQQLKNNNSLGGESDLMRFLNTIAGVQSGADGFGGLSVRGGNSDQNLVLLDGVPIYNPSHTLGLFSIFNSQIVKSVHFLQDGFSAKYGGRLSSVIEVRVKEGSTKDWQAQGEIGTIATKFMVEGPLKQEKTGLLLAIRRTHLDPFLANFSVNKKAANGNEGETSYYFFDLNAKLHHRFSNKDQLFVSFYTGEDCFKDETYYEYDDFDGEYYFEDQEQKIDWGNRILALRWNHLYGDQLFSNTTLTFSQYDYNSLNINWEFNELENEVLFDEYLYTTFQSKIQDAGLKIDFEYYLNSKHQFSFGVGALYRGFRSGELAYFFDDSIAGENALEEAEAIIDGIYTPPLFKAVELNLYAEDKLQLSNKLSLLTGIHVASFLTNEKTYVLPQPRFRLNWRFLPNWNTTFSGGRMSQFLHILSTTGSSLPNDLWVPSTKNVRPQTSWQIGWELSNQTDKGWKSSVAIFYKKLTHLITYETGADLPGLLEFDPTFWEDEITFGQGKSYGVSTAFEKTKGNLTGQFNYAYTLSERQFEDINQGEPYPFRYTHPHEVKIGFKHQFTPVFALNINWHFGSGQPISLIKSFERFAPLSNLTTSLAERIGSVNGYRLPAYHRLDLGCYFLWNQPKFAHHLNLGVYNLYNRKNPYYVYQYESIDFPEDNRFRQQNGLPILPSISYRVVFK